MRFLLMIAMICLILVSCGKKVDSPNATPSTELRNELQLRKQAILQWVRYRDGLPVYDEPGMPEGHNGNENWTNGMLCISGEKQFCKALQYDSGLLRRNTWTQYTSDEASRDEWIGAMAIWATIPNKSDMNRFLDAVQKYGSLCASGGTSGCRADPFYFGPWGTAFEVWSAAGLAPSGNMKAAKSLQADSDYILAQASHEPVGYRIHLQAIQLLTRQKLGRWNTTLRKAAEMLRSRQPENPFYAYLAEGKSDVVAKMALKYIPTSQPASRRSWYLQSDWDEKQWEQSCGWPDIFIINLLLN
jgi:hypothetical protein